MRQINVGGNQGRGNPPVSQRSTAGYSVLWAIFSAVIVLLTVAGLFATN